MNSAKLSFCRVRFLPMALPLSGEMRRISLALQDKAVDACLALRMYRVRFAVGKGSNFAVDMHYRLIFMFSSGIIGTNMCFRRPI